MTSFAKTLLIGGALLVTACDPAGNGGYSSSSSASGSSQQMSGRPQAAEGEFCGGIAGIMCGTGLTCRYDGTYPDAGGTCVRS